MSKKLNQRFKKILKLRVKNSARRGALAILPMLPKGSAQYFPCYVLC
nr:MAG TPA: hypothetical protein [Microviridae sp.]